MPEPLRALFINDTSRNGGPGTTLLNILKFLDPAWIERIALVPRPGIVSERFKQQGAAERLIFEPGLVENIFAPWSRDMERGDFQAAAPLKALRAAGNIMRAAASALRLARLVRREHIDVIFCNGTMANFFGGVLAMLTGKPVIWHVLYTSVGGLARKPHAALAAGRNVKRIICVSRPTSRQFAALPEKIVLLHDAIDVAEFNPAEAGCTLRRELSLPDDAVIFGSHGRVLPRKGYVEMIHAARLVMDQLTEAERARCHFVVIGDTPQDVKIDHVAECRALAATLGLAAQVHFIGFRAAVMPYLADFDIAIVPSVYQDPLPLTVMEAMAMAKPVIGFDVGGMAEMIEEGVTGRIAPAGDVATMAKACLDYMRDEDMRRRHGAAARARVERDFNARIHAGHIADELFRAAGKS